VPGGTAAEVSTAVPRLLFSASTQNALFSIGWLVLHHCSQGAHGKLQVLCSVGEEPIPAASEGLDGAAVKSSSAV